MVREHHYANGEVDEVNLRDEGDVDMPDESQDDGDNAPMRSDVAKETKRTAQRDAREGSHSDEGGATMPSGGRTTRYTNSHDNDADALHQKDLGKYRPDIIKRIADILRTQIKEREAAATVETTTTGSKRPFVQMKIGNLNVTALVDTGASVTIMKDKSFKKVQDRFGRRFPTIPIPPTLKINGVTGHTMRIVDYRLVEMEVEGHVMRRPTLVIKGMQDDVILGYDTIREEGIVIDAKQNKIFIDAKKVSPEEWNVATVVATEDTVIEPRTVTRVTTQAMVADRAMGNMTGIISPVDSDKNALWEGAVTTDACGRCVLPVVNLADEELAIKKGTILSTMRKTEEEHLMAAEEATVAGILGEIGPEPREPARGQVQTMTKEEEQLLLGKINIQTDDNNLVKKIQELIIEFNDVVSKTKFDLGAADVIKHCIRLTTDTPVHVRQFRIPYEHEAVLHEYVKELLEKKAIRPSRSPYNSPIFCVEKKVPANAPPGTKPALRAVVDYRMVNSRSIPDRYNIREVRDCIDAVGRDDSKIFSAIDLTSGFWQQLLEESSREYTAFTVPSLGTRYEWCVTPMGLQGSPASFSRLMAWITRELKGILTYIDDVLVHSKQTEEHVNQLRELFMRLRKYGLKLNPTKSIFATKQVQYLGFTLTPTGVSPAKDKLGAIKDCKEPTTIKQVREFVGMANYFRHLIRDFARRAAPLTALNRRTAAWEEGRLPQRAREAFDDLKKELTKPPVVAYPKREGEYILCTDGALGDKVHHGGLGAVLLQRQDGQEKVIAYASRALREHEKNYTAFLLELTAAVYGIEEFDTYLRGRRFELHVDHAPLESMGRSHTRTLNRLQQLMLDHTFTIKHKKGTENAVADFLSRNAAPVDIISTLSTTSDVQEIDIVKEQREDDMLRDVVTYKKDGNLPTHDEKYAECVKKTADQCIIDSGGIGWYHMDRLGMRPRLALWAPPSLRKNIVQSAHTGIASGHAGKDRTIMRVYSNYWWPKVTAAVGNFIADCPRCILAKGRKPAPAPLMAMPIEDAAGSRVHSDLVGPLWTRDGKKKYLHVMTDAFTRYAEVAAIPNKEAATVARSLFTNWICRHSVMERLVTDQGSEFTARVVKDLSKFFGFKSITTSPFHPEADGIAERFNRTMIMYFKAMLDNNTTLDWEEVIPAMTLAYNCHVHKATKESPFFLTYTHDPRLPFFDLRRPRPLYHEDNYAADAFRTMRYAHLKAKECMQEAARVQKEYYDKKTMERNFGVGDRILVVNPVTPTKRVNLKFYCNLRLATVEAVLPPVNIMVKYDDTGKTQVVHVNRARHAHHEEREAHCDAIRQCDGRHSGVKDNTVRSNLSCANGADAIMNLILHGTAERTEQTAGEDSEDLEVKESEERAEIRLPNLHILAEALAGRREDSLDYETAEEDADSDTTWTEEDTDARDDGGSKAGAAREAETSSTGVWNRVAHAIFSPRRSVSGSRPATESRAEDISGPTSARPRSSAHRWGPAAVRSGNQDKTFEPFHSSRPGSRKGTAQTRATGAPSASRPSPSPGRSTAPASMWPWDRAALGTPWASSTPSGLALHPGTMRQDGRDRQRGTTGWETGTPTTPLSATGTRDLPSFLREENTTQTSSEDDGRSGPASTMACRRRHSPDRSSSKITRTTHPDGGQRPPPEDADRKQADSRCVSGSGTGCGTSTFRRTSERPPTSLRELQSPSAGGGRQTRDPTTRPRSPEDFVARHTRARAPLADRTPSDPLVPRTPLEWQPRPRK